MTGAPEGKAALPTQPDPSSVPAREPLTEPATSLEEQVLGKLDAILTRLVTLEEKLDDGQQGMREEFAGLMAMLTDGLSNQYQAVEQLRDSVTKDASDVRGRLRLVDARVAKAEKAVVDLTTRFEPVESKVQVFDRLAAAE